LSSVRTHGGAQLEAAVLFDVYRGAPLEPTEKSLAVRLSFRSPDRTLTEAEIDAAIDAVRRGLAADVGGRIRT
jgi:phenylalanyl-tRNA synthetase beta chain